MEYTANYNFKKPSLEDGADIQALNDNFDEADNILAAKADKTEIPTALPANGGNADTVDGKHASDFATAAQGTKADNAMPKSGGTFTGVAVAGGSQAIGTAQVRNIVASQTDLVAGVSALPTGQLYIVFE